MSAKTPKFWYRGPDSYASAEERLLSPLSMLYGIGHRLHQLFEKPKAVDIPVICVGNINTGGTGKTPAALALMNIIQRNNLADMPYFLSRGYGGSEKGPLVVHSSHTFTQTGEEPLLLAQKSPTIVSSNRYKGAKFAIKHDADLLLMDDGLQNRSLERDLTFIIVDGSMGFGNQKLLPAGPLRQGLNEGFTGADAFILIGEDQRQIFKTLPVDMPVFRAHLKVDETRAPDKDKNYIAFAGLGYPQKFFSTLQDNGYTLLQTKSFSDHHPYTSEDIEKLYKSAIQQNASLITTEKDFLRLPEEFKEAVQVLPVYLSFENESVVVEFIQKRLKRAA